MIDILSIGDAAFDSFVKIHDATVTCSINKKTCQLCLEYANKIPIEGLEQKVAGNALNNAVGSARLGMKAAFYTVVGDDDIGKRIIATMKKEKVSTKYLQIQKNSPTNYSIVLNFQGERTLLTYSYPRTYALPAKIEPAHWVYYTAIGKNHAALEKQLLAYLKTSKAKLAFNPGTGHLKGGVAKIKSVLRATTVLFVNKEEGETLVGTSEGIGELFEKLHALGPKIVVITDGRAGAYASNGVNQYSMSIFPTPLVEATGAGDAFATGFVAALFHGKTVPEAMRWATANGGSVALKVGPQDGLLTVPQLLKLIEKYKTYQPKMINK